MRGLVTASAIGVLSLLGGLAHAETMTIRGTACQKNCEILEIRRQCDAACRKKNEKEDERLFWENCTGNSRVDWDLQITVCTALIQSDLETTQNRAIAYRNRGVAYRLKKEVERAIADFNEAIQRDPKDARSYYNRGLAKRAKGDTVGGNADVTQAKQLNPSVGN
jgi:tetratricopeptide (TPR) repeat protein